VCDLRIRCGARNWFIAPHSSASTWPNVIHRRCSTGTTLPIASETAGNDPRNPVWKSSGASALTRNWLNVKPRGGMSGVKVENRKMPSAISVVVVSIAIAPFVRGQFGANAGMRGDTSSGCWAT
jgi:hypothetical protein